MSLIIEAPEVEQRLKRQAERLGIPVENYVVKLLEDSLPVVNPPLETKEQRDERIRKFHEWVNGHRYRTPLPESATTRASFYADDADH